jgi:hypothetical protein
VKQYIFYEGNNQYREDISYFGPLHQHDNKKSEECIEPKKIKKRKRHHYDDLSLALASL